MRYRAAIIGTGRIGSQLEKDPLRAKPHTHAGWYAAHPGTALVAGADLDAARLAEFGVDWNIPSERLYTDYRAMLERERPDLVSICGYAPDRLEMCRAALAAGVRGLWIEKAVACSVTEAETLRSLVTTAGASAVVNHPRRADGRYQAVARAIRDGTYGQLESVHAIFSGSLVHTGTHCWDVLDLWCGPWTVARGWLDAGGTPGASRGFASRDAVEVAPHATVVDRGGRAHIVFENGVHAFVSGGTKQYFVFQFDLVFGNARVQLGNDVARLWRPGPSPRYSHVIELTTGTPLRPDVDAAVPLLDTLVGALDTGRPCRDSLDAAAAALTLGVAVFQSALEGHAAVAPADVRRELWLASV
jgi:predicted dehydrogenase